VVTPHNGGHIGRNLVCSAFMLSEHWDLVVLVPSSLAGTVPRDGVDPP